MFDSRRKKQKELALRRLREQQAREYLARTTGKEDVYIVESDTLHKKAGRKVRDIFYFIANLILYILAAIGLFSLVYSPTREVMISLVKELLGR